jgi:hypothetical protein
MVCLDTYKSLFVSAFENFLAVITASYPAHEQRRLQQATC